MARTVIYMNHHIRDREVTEPVITVMRGGRVVYADEVVIRDRGGRVVARVVFRRQGLKGAPHNVRAWVETDAHVEVLP